MKKANEKKQDLLLDALSCIDEDILARGLALRDREAAAPQTTAVPPALFDLSELDRKPPRRSSWRVILVAAAIIMLLAVVPLSVWMVANREERAPAGGTVTDGLTGSRPTDGGMTREENDFVANTPSDPAPEENHTEDPEGIEPGMPSETTEPSPSLDEPERLSWTVVSNRNNNVLYLTRGENGVDLVLEGLVLTPEASDENAVSPENHTTLELLGQWTFSLMTFDYTAHFPLFHEKTVEKRFLSQLAANGFTYDQAITRIRERSYTLLPLRHMTLNVTLTESRILTGDEFESCRQMLAEDVPDPSRITAIQHITFTGTVALNHELIYDLTEAGVRELICYEYNGVWYLDHHFMDDDISIDLLLSEPSSDRGYFKTQTTTCTVMANAMQNGYILTDGGSIFLTDNVEVYAQTDNGDWERVPYTHIHTGETVTVTYYTFALEGITVVGQDEPCNLSCAVAIRIVGE